jgi:predicted Zn-dependent protease
LIYPPAGGAAGIRTRLRRAALLAVLLPLLGGCVSEAREKSLGSQIAASLNSRVPLVQDVPLSLYVNDLGNLVARHSGRPGLQYHFYIVDSDAVNAFALPGGYVYVNRGLIQRTHNVSELAGVLAHEVAHVALRHGAKNLQRQMRTSSMSTLLYRSILGRAPLLDQQALQMGNQLWYAAHSRADEAAADREAVRYLIRSGIDPRGMVSLFQQLMREERNDPRTASVEWFNSHPNTASRLTATEHSIQALMPRPTPDLADNNASYPHFLARLALLPPSPAALPSAYLPH